MVFLEGIDKDCLASLGNCLLVHFIFGISRDHLLLNVLFFASPALSLSWVHCGLSSVAQVSLWDKVRYQLSEKGERCSPVTGCFFPEVVSLDLEHHVFWPWGNAVNYQEHNLFDLDSLKKKKSLQRWQFQFELELCKWSVSDYICPL